LGLAGIPRHPALPIDLCGMAFWVSDDEVVHHPNKNKNDWTCDLAFDVDCMSHTPVIGVGTTTRPTVSHEHNTPNTHLVLGSSQRPPHTAAAQPADTTTFGPVLVQILIID
jgi:hypothetical protein